MVEYIQNKVHEKTPEREIAQYTDSLNFSQRTLDHAVRLFRQTQKLEAISRRSIKSKIAAALYIAGVLEGERRTQKRISEVIGVSRTTIRTHYRDIVHKLDLRQR